MGTARLAASALAAAVAVAFVQAACTDAVIQPKPADQTTLDDRLAIRGTVCTSRPDPSGFPVKVIFLVDSSGSMCVSDPPGSNQASGFCEMAPIDPATGQPFTEPGRVRALKSLMATLRTQPNVEVALIPFESKIPAIFPATMDGTTPEFARASSLSDTDIESLQSNLGKATDYQGALSEAYRRIKSDILQLNPAILPRTKYVVVLFTDGAPYPRCAAANYEIKDQVTGIGTGVWVQDPAVVWATPANPDGLWVDNPQTFCDADQEDIDDPTTGMGTDPNGNPVFLSGTDRNQNYQLFDVVSRLMDLKDLYNVGDLKLHTVLLFSEEAATRCGQICAIDLYGWTLPLFNASSNWVTDTTTMLSFALKKMADMGGGIFQKFKDGQTLSFGSLDYSSLASRFTAKTLMARNLYALPTASGVVVDSDGDGLPDSMEGAGGTGTSPYNPDTDADGFSDGFEWAHRSEGFDPLKPDPRGCVAIPPDPAPYDCRDTDGDGLTTPMEAYFWGSNNFDRPSTIVDWNTNGIPDGLEAQLGLDPRIRSGPTIDQDLDGVTDYQETIVHTAPMVDDRAPAARDSYAYDLTPTIEADGRTCYDFVVSNIRLLTPDRPSNQIGFNLITVTFAEAPESNTARDYGMWRQACVWAQFAPPSIRVPAGPEIELLDTDFFPIDDFRTSRCKGVAP